MHRVELKGLGALPPPTGQTSFLMHRVELKGGNFTVATHPPCLFLMHRVELKAVQLQHIMP